MQGRKRIVPEKNRLKRKKITNPEIKNLFNLMAADPNPLMRAYAAASLCGLAKRKLLGKAWQLEVTNALQASLFELSRSVRITASHSLAEIKGWRYVVELIEKKYPGKALSRVPAEYFQRYTTTEIGLRLRKMNSQSVGQLLELRKKYGKPVFHYRGMPVFLSKGTWGKGMYEKGAIILNENRKILPKKFRESVAAHEFGEIFGHEVGNVMQMLCLEKQGLFSEYIQRERTKYLEFRNIVRQDPNGFAGFRKYFPEIRK